MQNHIVSALLLHFSLFDPPFDGSVIQTYYCLIVTFQFTPSPLLFFLPSFGGAGGGFFFFPAINLRLLRSRTQSSAFPSVETDGK